MGSMLMKSLTVAFYKHRIPNVIKKKNEIKKIAQTLELP